MKVLKTISRKNKLIKKLRNENFKLRHQNNALHDVIYENNNKHDKQVVDLMSQLVNKEWYINMKQKYE